MTERPILFQGDMVRALLDGSKTQTRRIFKPDRMTWDTNGRYTTHAMRDGELTITGSGPFKPNSWLHYCPYGQPGDRLWVRENFCPIYPQDPAYNGGQPIEYDYQATYQHGDRLGDLLGIVKKWKPSIHMPRAASRITLEITAVRIERLQDISRGDAMAEGCPFPNMANGDDPRKWYADLWNTINGTGSWDANPWVWVVEFKRLKGCAA